MSNFPTSNQLKGVFNVVSIPLNDEDQIDQSVLKKEIDWLIKCGSDGLVLAMVSEVLRFSAQERRVMWQKTLEYLQGRKPLVVSVGAESSAIAVELAKQAAFDGAAAVMATPPSAFKATASEVKKYYQSIIEAVDIPTIVQDASNYLGEPIQLETYVELIDKYGENRVQFKPEAKPVAQRLDQLNKLSSNRAKVFEGQGGVDLLQTHPLGVKGSMPGAEIPWAIIELWRSLEQGNLDKAKQIHQPVARLVALQTSLDAYIAVEKYLLVKQGVFINTNQRGPVGFKLDKQTTESIEAAYEDLTKVVTPVKP
ncbi:MAG: L-2-keto-3-deoxyarabonate dehydratase [Actinomycetota bacterium]|jgi:dihydrodipicolinate synthase/N-acetylneuraminate lyase